MSCPVGDSKALHQFIRPPAGLSFGLCMGNRSSQYVLPNGKIGEQVEALKHKTDASGPFQSFLVTGHGGEITAVDDNLPDVWAQEATGYQQQCALAAAAGTGDGGKRTGLNPEIDIP